MAFKAARCPSCSGELMLDPEKKSGFCNHCGSEIIVQEAITAMKLDGVASLDNLLHLAQEAFDDGDYEGAYDFYNRCYELDPMNSFVIYGRSIAHGHTLTGEDQGKAFKVVAGVKRALENASDSDKEILAKRASVDLNNLASMYFQAFKHNYESIQMTAAQSASVDVHTEVETTFVSWVVVILYMLEYASTLSPNNKAIINNIINITSIFINRNAHSKDVVTIDWSENGGFQEYIKMLSPSVVKDGFNIVYYEPSAVKMRAINRMNELKETQCDTDDNDITIIDSSHQINKAGYCYIATAIYGDYNAPEVKVLRSFRDEKLLKTDAGRLFVRGYYSVGPVLAKTVARQPLLNGYVRRVLNKMVKSIQK